MSPPGFLLWVVLPYACLAVFVAGHASQRRRGQLTGTTGLGPLFEQKPFRAAVLLFHFGAFAAVGGHLLGTLVPAGVTGALGVDEDAYHLIALVAGGTAGVAMSGGLLILLYRRIAVPSIRATTTRSDLLAFPLLAIAILTGMLAIFAGNLVSAYQYRATVSPWFRGLFTFHMHAAEMAGAPFLFQLHAACVWLLFAVWPFSRLVHVWGAPLFYLRRAWVAATGRPRGTPVSDEIG